MKFNIYLKYFILFGMFLIYSSAKGEDLQEIISNDAKMIEYMAKEIGVNPRDINQSELKEYREGYCNYWSSQGGHPLIKVKSFCDQNFKVIKSKNVINKKGKKHNDCLDAKDYVGCMEFNDNSKIKNNNKKLNCLNKWCKPYEYNGTDNLGKKVIEGFWFKDSPTRQTSLHYDPQLYKLNIADQSARYINLVFIYRYYQKPIAGTSGYSSSYGGGTTNCSSYGNSINCYTTQPYTINIPGSSAKPGGVIQARWDYVLDCEKKEYSQYIDGKIRKSTNSKGRKKKWVTFENKGTTLIREGIDFCTNNISKIDSLKDSDFYKFKPRKRR